MIKLIAFKADELRQQRSNVQSNWSSILNGMRMVQGMVEQRAGVLFANWSESEAKAMRGMLVDIKKEIESRERQSHALLSSYDQKIYEADRKERRRPKRRRK